MCDIAWFRNCDLGWHTLVLKCNKTNMTGLGNVYVYGCMRMHMMHACSVYKRAHTSTLYQYYAYAQVQVLY
jgi:hypothetical protein